MVKNVRETILLMILFVFVILIVQFTGISTIKVKSSIEVPETCNLLVRIDLKGLSKKILLSELYSHRASELFKDIYKLGELDDEFEKDRENPFIEFSDNLNSISEPLEVLSINIGGKEGVFLRTLSQHKTTNYSLYSSNNNYLYVQLYGPTFKRQEILSAINSSHKYKLSKAPNSDIQIYEKTNNDLDLKGYVNTSSKNIMLHILHKSENQLNEKIKAKGLHFYSGANHLSAINSMKSLKNKMKNISINYFGLNSYGNPVLFPNTDMLFEFEDSVNIDDLSSLMKSSFKSSLISVLSESKDSGTIKFDDVDLTYKLFNSNSIYISTNNRTMELTETSGSIELGGDLSQLLRLNDKGWKGILANEMITGIPILNELRMFLTQLHPTTTHSENESIITLKLEGNQSIYSYLFSMLGKL